MDYPNDFNVPAFPAGKTIALSRSISVWILIVFFFIIVACGFLLFTRGLKNNYPFLISISPLDEWSVVAYPNKSEKTLSRYEIIQEKLVNDFVMNWFTISPNANINESRWSECTIEECKSPEQFDPSNIACGISCKSDQAVFAEFKNKVFPQYHAMIDLAHETWKVGEHIFVPIVISESGSKWQVHLTINSATMGIFNVLIFMEIKRDSGLYPATFGYYVSKFNAYRVGQQ